MSHALDAIARSPLTAALGVGLVVGVIIATVFGLWREGYDGRKKD